MARVITAEEVVAAAFDAMAGPFGWDGASDCSATACAAFETLTGLDLMRGLRGAYGTQAEALALIRARGGFLALWSAQAALCGLAAGAPETGAIGVIRTETMAGRALGLCVRPGLWAAKSPKGAALTPAIMERCWNA
ncbi:hypothetical protein PVT71_13590 [Salipiger sp. H15]|uniref:DUF6950 domain-containing protein n=1 Tax=Alloyangia sp. H15 TaxID=3029062 RepID=A0AAU8AG79_9RHOB